MHGENEQNCLEIVKKSIATESFFAMSAEDERIVRHAINNAIPNPQISEFPDFLFDKGFIEHFQVTSSATTRKGATMAWEKSQIDKEFDRLTKEAISNLDANHMAIQTVESELYWHKKHSYDNFVHSFRSNFEHHIESLSKYKVDYEHSIYLIEYGDSVLRKSKKYPQNLMQEVSYGDLLLHENSAYRLSRDIELLKYLKEKSSYVKYVIFVNADRFSGTSVDVISSSNSLEIIKLLGEGYDFHCAMVGSSKVGIGVAIPMAKEKHINE